MKKTFRLMASLLIATCATAASSQEITPTSGAMAKRLLELAARSLGEKDLGLATLRFDQALRLDPAAAQASAVARELEEVSAREEQCMNAGAEAARAREAAAVRKAVQCLRKSDVHSSGALQIIFLYQAELANLGGAFPRVSWNDWRNAPKTELFSSPASAMMPDPSK